MNQTLSDLRPEKNQRYAWTDLGAGNLFADVHKDVARFNPDRGIWYAFTGKRWEADTGNLHVHELAKRLADALTLYALSLEDERTREDYVKFCARWQRRSFRETIVKEAASVHPVSLAAFDADLFAFNCQNGTLNLRNFTFHAHTPADMLTKLAGVAYDPDARCERWERFIDEVMCGDHERAQYLQKALGYALTGDASRECFFVLFGPTSRNGKGTCMETYARLMGDYARAASPDTIAQRQTPHGGGPSEDIARLAGARFVNISEPDKRLVLSAAKVKTLTGNDTISARFLNENSFEFRPAFKLFVNTNYLPQTTDTTLFSSGRVRVLPFERHFEPHEQDQWLKSTLTTPSNLSGILNWCIDGLTMLEEKGFDPPASVLAATDAYAHKSDRIAQFLEDETMPDPNADAQLSAVYARYTSWCESNGCKAESLANFKDRLAGQRGITIRRKRPRGSGQWGNPVSMAEGLKLTSTAGNEGFCDV